MINMNRDMWKLVVVNPDGKCGENDRGIHNRMRHLNMGAMELVGLANHLIPKRHVGFPKPFTFIPLSSWMQTFIVVLVAQLAH